MQCTDYRKGVKKPKSILASILITVFPEKSFLPMGKPRNVLLSGQTGVLDRGYQSHDLFDLWQEEGKHFVCRIKSKTKKCIAKKDIDPNSNIFYDAIVLSGSPGISQTKKTIRLVGYIVDGF